MLKSKHIEKVEKIAHFSHLFPGSDIQPNTQNCSWYQYHWKGFFQHLPFPHTLSSWLTGQSWGLSYVTSSQVSLTWPVWDYGELQFGTGYFQLEGTRNFYGARKSCPWWPWWLRQVLSSALFLEHKFSRHAWTAAATGTNEWGCVMLLRKHWEVVETAL